ncbi:Serine/threonine-protein kinase-interacting protein [Sesamum alatum]|uniref:Serine/threonine-protein kinase-interacting protein n=1 Tax=Sesamum alatum TaxID=300844 RepID=A0AAE2C9P8_9LAMI|nr:Serine/threonine-protein kinase-interacting protein [Sesamum alatum]
MAIVTGDRYLESLVKFVEDQAERLIEGTLVLKLNPVGLRYVQSRFEALEELESLLAGAPVDYLRAYVSDLGDHRALEQLRRILRLLPSLKVVSVLPPPGRDPTPLFLLPFGRLKVLELRGCDLSTSTAKGLLELRFTLEKLICHNSTDALRHVFASRIADIKDSPPWNRLSFVSCPCNSLVLMDESLQLLPAVETLDLSRNKFAKVDNLRKCTKLKHVDLGFNNLRSIASFTQVSCQIVKLVLRNNALTSLHGIEKLKSLQGLDLSYNIISNFSEIEILAGLPALQNLWLEGNPLCYARWFRAQVFSLFSHPERLKLDEKEISKSEYWERQIIIASRQKQPASFGFYSPVQDDADVDGSINTKRKRISRLVSIESDERSTYISSDQDSLSCDNEIQGKDENTNAHEAEIEDLMNRIELMKKDHSVLWLQEFKEWMNQTSENFVDGNKFRSTILHNNQEFGLKSETKDEDFAETSRHIFDSFQLSGDDSSTMILESETSFADSSTVVSGQQYFDQIGEAAPRFFMGHAGGDRSVSKDVYVNQEELRLLNNQGSASVDAGKLPCNSIAVVSGDNASTEIAMSASTAINDIMSSHSSSARLGSPPHYQEDVLHRRHNLEEEFLQLSAESFSVASSDSNTSCSEDDSAEVGPSGTHVDQYLIDDSSERSHSGFPVASYQDDACDVYHDKISSLKQNGTYASSPCAEGKFVNTNGRELKSSALACRGSFSGCVHDDKILGPVKGKSEWLEQRKCIKKPTRRMISLPEDDDAHGDIDSSKNSSGPVETCRCEMIHDGQEICCSIDMWKSTPARNNGDSAGPTVLGQCYRGTDSEFNTSNDEKDDFIETYFNSKVADSGVNETSSQYVRCNCLFVEKPGHKEREVAVLRSSEQKLYILLVHACKGSETTLEMVACHRVGDVREVFVGLGFQVIRVCFEGNATYLLITRSMDRSTELLCLLDFFDPSGIKNTCSITSLEQIQINLFQDHVCGGSNINIFQYSMVLFSQKNFKENLWLPRSLFVLKEHLLLCTEDLMQFGPSENAFSPCYFLLDSCCAVVDVSEMAIDTSDSPCVTLALRRTSEFHPSEKWYRTEHSFSSKKRASGPVTWKLKWFSKDSLFKFVALLKAIHGQVTSSSLVRYAS